MRRRRPTSVPIYSTTRRSITTLRSRVSAGRRRRSARSWSTRWSGCWYSRSSRSGRPCGCCGGRMRRASSWWCCRASRSRCRSSQRSSVSRGSSPPSPSSSCCTGRRPTTTSGVRTGSVSEWFGHGRPRPRLRPRRSDPGERVTESHTVTVLGTTDLHGRVLDWDYHRDGPYRDDWGNVTGLARVASVVRRVRAEIRSPILIDNGDFLQGTPLVSHAADGLLTGRTHPMAVAMNALGFDAAVTGNHEFDYGLDVLRAFESDAEFPLLGGNVIDRATGDTPFVPYIVREVDVPGGRPVRVAIIGLAHPGTGVWNRMQVGETLRFDGLVGAARRWVHHAREHGADVVVVAAHCGATEGETGARHVYEGVDRVAERVPGVDAILAGHTHREVECQRFVNGTTGEQTIVTMPMCWGMRVAAIDITVARAGDGYRVVERNARLIDTSEADEDPEIVRLAEHDHRAVVDAGRTHVGTSSAAFGWCGAPWRPVPIVSLVQNAQAAAVADSVGALPVVSVAAVPHYTAAIPRGDVPRRAVENIASLDRKSVV